MRKYKRGRQIRSLDEMMSKELIIVETPDKRKEKTYHRGWFGSWQVRMCKHLIDNNQVYAVDRIKKPKKLNKYHAAYFKAALQRSKRL